MALTAKQQRFVESSMYEKLAALHAISKHLGFLPRNEQEAATNHAVVGEPIISLALVGFLAEDREPWQRAACAAILDLISIDWRNIAEPEIFGPVVDRDSPEVRRWRQQVLERDGFECCECGTENQLHAHHIVRWADAPELRITVSNGTTLCERCHRAVHARSMN